MKPKNYLTGLRDFSRENKPRFISYLLLMLLASQALIIAQGDSVDMETLIGGAFGPMLVLVAAIFLNVLYPHKKA
jgi:heme O synthase-like polyprenyltransferase